MDYPNGNGGNPLASIVAPYTPPQPTGPAPVPTAPSALTPPAAAGGSGSSFADYLPTGGTGLLGALFGGLAKSRQNDLAQQFEADLTNNAKTMAPQQAIVQTLMSNPAYFHRLDKATLSNALTMIQASQKAQGQVVQSGANVGVVSQGANGQPTLQSLGSIQGPLFQVANGSVIYSPVDAQGKPLLGPDGNPVVKSTIIDPNAKTQSTDLGGVVQIWHMGPDGKVVVDATLNKSQTPGENLAQVNLGRVGDDDGLAALAAGAPATGELAKIATKYNLGASPAAAAQAILNQKKVTALQSNPFTVLMGQHQDTNGGINRPAPSPEAFGAPAAATPVLPAQPAVASPQAALSKPIPSTVPGAKKAVVNSGPNKGKTVFSFDDGKTYSYEDGTLYVPGK